MLSFLWAILIKNKVRNFWYTKKGNEFPKLSDVSSSIKLPFLVPRKHYFWRYEIFVMFKHQKKLAEGYSAKRYQKKWLLKGGFRSSRSNYMITSFPDTICLYPFQQIECWTFLKTYLRLNVRITNNKKNYKQIVLLLWTP